MGQIAPQFALLFSALLCQLYSAAGTAAAAAFKATSGMGPVQSPVGGGAVIAVYVVTTAGFVALRGLESAKAINNKTEIINVIKASSPEGS